MNLRKAIEVLSGILFIILGVIWVLSITNDWKITPFIEPITIVVSGFIWLALAIMGKMAKKDEDGTQTSFFRIFQIHFGKGNNVGRDFRVIKRSEEKIEKLDDSSD